MESLDLVGWDGGGERQERNGYRSLSTDIFLQVESKAQKPGAQDVGSISKIDIYHLEENKGGDA